jgi:iron complex transport system ATP-binding protein
MLQAKTLRFAAGRRLILEDVSMSLTAGQFTALLGVNGAGKTTLLRLLLGLIRPSRGAVLLDEQNLTALSRRKIAQAIAYVPQAHVPAFPYTVREMVAMGRNPGLGLGRRLDRHDESVVAASLERLGMLRFAETNYASLSGGERQAVLIARALAQDARILILDEPGAALDLAQHARLMTLLSALATDGYAIMMSLHQPDHALRWCNRAVLLHEGKILANGPVRAVVTAANLSTLYRVPIRLVEVLDHAFAVPEVYPPQ